MASQGSSTPLVDQIDAEGNPKIQQDLKKRKISVEAEDIKLLEPPKDLVEHLTIGSSEPGAFASKLMQVKGKIPEDRYQELLKLVNRPGVPKEIHMDIRQCMGRINKNWGLCEGVRK